MVVQVKYHVNVIYSLGGGDTYTPMLQTKEISRNQVRAGLWLAHTWINKLIYSNI